MPKVGQSVRRVRRIGLNRIAFEIRNSLQRVDIARADASRANGQCKPFRKLPEQRDSAREVIVDRIASIENARPPNNLVRDIKNVVAEPLPPKAWLTARAEKPRAPRLVPRQKTMLLQFGHEYYFGPCLRRETGGAL